MKLFKKIFCNKYLSIALLAGLHYSGVFAQGKGALQGELRQSDGSVLKGARVYLQWPETGSAVDSALTDSNGVFHFDNFPFGNYSIGLNLAGVDNAVADVLNLSSLNPLKRNQHFRIDDGSLVCTESNYVSIKEASENAENVFTLNLNSLQHDVAEKSLSIGTDGSKKLGPRIGEFVNLESLSININSISSLPAEIGKLKKLTVLSASLNKLSTLPAEMPALTNLKTIDLGKNAFTIFPEVITGNAGLLALNFQNNAISSLPASINGMKSLKELNLANCQELLALPPQLCELNNLETLDISGCIKLRSLPEEIINLKNLKVLDVSGTKISTKKFQEAVPGCEIRK